MFIIGIVRSCEWCMVSWELSIYPSVKVRFSRLLHKVSTQVCIVCLLVGRETPPPTVAVYLPSSRGSNHGTKPNTTGRPTLLP